MMREGLGFRAVAEENRERALACWRAENRERINEEQRKR
jgi:hypothetical protein